MKILITAMAFLCVLGCSKDGPEVAPRKETEAKMDIDMQWGGYYASREEGEDQYGVFRLLDFNRYAYQVAIFREVFPEVPPLEDVLRLSPFIGHAPIDSQALLCDREIHLLGGPPLTADDLAGYRLYLEHCEMAEAEIDELFQTVIEFGNQPPMKLTLTLVDGELDVTGR